VILERLHGVDVEERRDVFRGIASAEREGRHAVPALDADEVVALSFAIGFFEHGFFGFAAGGAERSVSHGS